MSDEMVLNVSALSKTGSVSRVGGKYRFHVRVDGGNSSSCPLGWSGVTINVPTINSREKYLATNIQVSAIGCDSPSQYAPGDEIWGFLDDGSFGKKAATCLLMEAVREQWPPHERIALEAVLLTKYSKLDLHVRVWSTRPDTRDGFGDPDWNATTQKDQQGIAAYPISLRFSLLDEAKDFWNKLFGAKESPKGGIPEKKSNQPFTTSIPTDAQRQSLFTAAMEGDLKKANAMLKNSPGLVFSRDSSYGSTALHWAAGKGRKEIVELLLANGADVNAKNKDGETPLYLAARDGRMDAVELLLTKGADVNAKNKDGETPLYLVAGDGRKDVVELLLAKGADVNAKDKDRFPALHRAASRGHKEIVELLLANGADVNAKEKDDYTTLHWAVGIGDTGIGRKEIVELLLAKGADVNAKDKYGCTALYWAAGKGRKEIVELLLAKGADVNAKAKRGGTALHWAAGQSHKEIVELLLANGADVNAKNDGGESSLEVAVRYSQKEVLELFRQRSEKQGSLVSKLSDKLIMEILQRLRTSHIKVQGLRKSGSISELIDNVIPKLAYVQPQDSVRIFAAYQKSISSSPLIILRACGNEKDLCYDLDALLQDYSVHVDDHYSVVTDTENSIASIAVHNKGSANGRVLNIFVWREAELYRFIGQRGAYTDSTGLTVGRRYS
jgi:ankyrin repeat protein